MIAVIKDLARIPASLTSLACQTSLTEVLNIADPDHKKKIKQRFYGDDDVVRRLKAIYHCKCAYCESFEPDPEVEHFRPKGRVQDVPDHTGYFWLCYEWTNLLPACHDCNKNGVKGNYFPVEGTRQTAPPPLLPSGALDLDKFKLLSPLLTTTEIPMFLNPEVPGFDPFNYFRFDRFGEIIENSPIGTIEFRKAKWTIKIADLNRPKLYLNLRKKQIRYYMEEINAFIYQFRCKEISTAGFEKNIKRKLSQIKTKANPAKEYSFFWSYFYRNFDQYLTAYIKPKYSPKLFQIVNEFRQENP